MKILDFQSEGAGWDFILGGGMGMGHPQAVVLLFPKDRLRPLQDFPSVCSYLRNPGWRAGLGGLV